MVESSRRTTIKGICFEHQCVPLLRGDEAEEQLYRSWDRTGDGYIHVSARSRTTLMNWSVNRCVEQTFHDELDLPWNLEVDLMKDDTLELAHLRTLFGYATFVDSVSHVQFHVYAMPRPASPIVHPKNVVEDLPTVLTHLREHALFLQPVNGHVTILFAGTTPTMEMQSASAYAGGCSDHPVIVIGYDDSQNIATRRHEMSHAWRLFSEVGICSWLDEGLAERAEDDPSLSPEEMVRNLLPEKMEGIWNNPQMENLVWSSKNPEEAQLRYQSYLIAHAFILYVDSLYPRWRLRFERELMKTGSAEEAFKKAVGLSAEDLQEGFWRWIYIQRQERELMAEATRKLAGTFAGSHFLRSPHLCREGLEP